jgi:DNA repair exonuclease SbcCD ATPase subunit
MFLQLRATNFRQHRELNVTFTPGVNALRGKNEAGKTTILEAIAYVMFGAKIALRQPIDEVVTWGEKSSSLKAELDAQINGVTYRGKRSKAGAEIWLAEGLKPLVTGQDECTRFWETLLGVSAKVASNLMLANQQSLRGALEGGPSAPVALIETLANFRLIDTIINLVKEKLPNGQTGQTEARVAGLQERLAAPVEDDGLAELQVEFDASHATNMAASGAKVQAQIECDNFAERAQAAQSAVNAADRAQQLVTTAVGNFTRAQQALEGIVVPPTPDTSRVDELRQQVNDAQRLVRARTAHKALQGLGEPNVEWDEGMEKLHAARAFAAGEHSTATTKVGDLRVARTRNEGQIIRETQCSFCDKDLSQVPEATTRNHGLMERIAEIDTEIAEWQARIAEQAELMDTYDGIINDARNRGRVYQQCAEFITLNEAFVPARWTWTGPDVAQEPGNPAALLQAIENEQRAHDQAKGRLAQAEANVEIARTAWADAQQVAAEAKALADRLAPDLVTADELASKAAAAEARFRATNEAYRVSTAQAVRREREGQKARLAADLAAAQLDLDKMKAGNRLLEKLRSARPQIADKLWAVVLQSVSLYFSQIRGVKSVVTRSDNGFQVDGQNIGGLSGSTLDALGLAIRIALTKTFLPNARFLVLDEPAAACDDSRETNMIGLVATSDFDQVILVTHSDLADSFAAQVIQL